MRLECGDCLQLMKDIPDGSVDLIVTDPPYEFHSGHGGGSFGTEAREYHDELKGLDKGVTDAVLEEFMRVLKVPNLYIWCNKNQIRQYLNFFCDRGCTYDVLTWHKTNPVPTCNNKYLSDTEYCLYFRKGAQLYGSYDTKHKYWVTELNTKDKDLYDHPTIKPLDIIQQLVENSSLPGELVLDPFMGSGTTGVACILSGRDFIGYEIAPNYFETAKKRVESCTNASKAARTLEDFI
jgi:DNA modification methylase